ncbi:unnamed protein product [Cylindrotheca closterium]|uniref:Uncharacterized protein n=1 Tax=Cylindrotheca closterium TaxID=2856 RepID=A0AAD2CV52_9STRA|nr:unnamed protein product [Cylindrotheca closterium]
MDGKFFDPKDNDKVVVREPQWMYMGPILAAPIAHICVTLYRDAKTPRQKQLLLGVGVVGTTIATFGMRLYLFSHAGYPGTHNAGATQRERTVTLEEKKALIDDASISKKARETMRGFA